MKGNKKFFDDLQQHEDGFCGNLSSFIKKNYGLAANSLHGSEKVMSILCIYLFFVYICDNLYVDVTGLTRILSHPPVQMNEITNEQVVQKVVDYIDKLLERYNPRRLLFLAFDGIVPSSVLMAKRNRNYVVERILLCKKDNIQSCRRKIKFGDHSVPTRNVETMEVEKDVPGTEFSLLLSSKVSEHVRNRLTEHRYRNLNLVYSGPRTPESASTKILRFLREQSSHEVFRFHLHHYILCSSDDCILYSLLTDLERVCLIAFEELQYRCDICLKLGHTSKNCRYEFDDNNNVQPTYYPTYYKINLDLLRGAILVNLGALEKPTRRRFQACHDFVLLYYLCGSDFLPGITSFSHLGFNEILSIYRGSNVELIKEERLDLKALFIFMDIVLHSSLTGMPVDVYNDKYFETNEIDDRKKMVAQYLQGLQWMVEYIYRGNPDWDFVYPCSYSPHLTDLCNFGLLTVYTFHSSIKLHPLEQLLCILLSVRSHLLPEKWRYLITDQHTITYRLYRTVYLVCEDTDKSVAKLPEFDIPLVRFAAAPLVTLLSKKESLWLIPIPPVLFMSSLSDNIHKFLGCKSPLKKVQLEDSFGFLGEVNVEEYTRFNSTKDTFISKFPLVTKMDVKFDLPHKSEPVTNFNLLFD